MIDINRAHTGYTLLCGSIFFIIRTHNAPKSQQPINNTIFIPLTSLLQQILDRYAEIISYFVSAKYSTGTSKYFARIRSLSNFGLLRPFFQSVNVFAAIPVSFETRYAVTPLSLKRFANFSYTFITSKKHNIFLIILLYLFRKCDIFQLPH